MCICTDHGTWVEVRGQPEGVDFLLQPCGSQGSNSGFQAWYQVPLSTEPFLCPLFLIFGVMPCIYFFFQYHTPGQSGPLMTGRGSSVQFGVLHCFCLLLPPVWHWIRFQGHSNKEVSSWLYTCFAKKCPWLSTQRPFPRKPVGRPTAVRAGCSLASSPLLLCPSSLFGLLSSGLTGSTVWEEHIIGFM